MNRLFLLLALFFTNQIGFCQTNKSIIVNDKWMEFESIPQRIEALQIRPNIISTLSTEKLLDECLNFPYLIDFYIYGRNQQAFELITKEFNGFQELVNRSDLPYSLLKKFSQFPQDVERLENVGNEQKGFFSLQTLVLEYILIQDSVINHMSTAMLDSILFVINENKEIIHEYPTIFNGSHDFPINSAFLYRSNDRNEYTQTRGPSNYYTDTTIYTPKGTGVSARLLTHSDITPADSAMIMYEMATNYSQAEIIEGPTMKYNCHAYAWHVSEGGNKVWLNRPNESAYWTDGSYKEIPESLATKVSYLGDHSAIRLSSSMYMSKWGDFPLVKHSPTYVPTGYSTPNKYYVRAPYFSCPDIICTQIIININNLPDSAGVALNTSYSSTGYSIEVSPTLSIVSYSNGSLTVQKVSNGHGYIKVYYKGYLLSTREFWVGAPVINDVYYMGGNVYMETDWESIPDIRKFYVEINGTRYRLLGGMGSVHLPNGTYNVEAYVSNECGESDHYFTQIVITGSYLYSVANISISHQVTIQAVDYSGSPQPLEASMAESKSATSVPYSLKSVQTGEIAAQGEMPIGGGTLNFSNMRSGLYILEILSRSGDTETFKIQFI